MNLLCQDMEAFGSKRTWLAHVRGNREWGRWPGVRRPESSFQLCLALQCDLGMPPTLSLLTCEVGRVTLADTHGTVCVPGTILSF